jgi:hypothetical protein
VAAHAWIWSPRPAIVVDDPGLGPATLAERAVVADVVGAPAAPPEDDEVHADNQSPLATVAPRTEPKITVRTCRSRTAESLARPRNAADQREPTATSR